MIVVQLHLIRKVVGVVVSVKEDGIMGPGRWQGYVLELGCELLPNPTNNKDIEQLERRLTDCIKK